MDYRSCSPKHKHTRHRLETLDSQLGTAIFNTLFRVHGQNKNTPKKLYSFRFQPRLRIDVPLYRYVLHARCFRVESAYYSQTPSDECAFLLRIAAASIERARNQSANAYNVARICTKHKHTHTHTFQMRSLYVGQRQKNPQ